MSLLRMGMVRAAVLQLPVQAAVDPVSLYLEKKRTGPVRNYR